MGIYFLHLFTTLLLINSGAKIDNSPDAILGKWETLQDNLIVDVYKEGHEYKAKVVWFKNSSEKTKPSTAWIDEKNPNKSLRSRKVLGMEVLQHLVWNPNNQKWEKGRIYDSTTGKEWNSSAWLTEDHLLNVRGFWHFEFLGRNMVFKRI